MHRAPTSTGGGAVSAAMAKKQSRNRSRREPSGSEFAEAAINLYHRVLHRADITDATNALSPEDRRDAEAMASSFACIYRQLENCTKHFTPEQYVESGLGQAFQLLDALTSKRDWPPLSRFLASLRASGFRNQNAPPTPFENQKRAVVSGFAQALRSANDDMSETAAIERVISLCRFTGVTFTVGQISKWRTQTKDSHGHGPEQTGNMIFTAALNRSTKLGEPLSQSVEAVGVYWVRGFWTVPHIS
jgi:hypothetical protein